MLAFVIATWTKLTRNQFRIGNPLVKLSFPEQRSHFEANKQTNVITSILLVFDRSIYLFAISIESVKLTTPSSFITPKGR